MSPYGEEHTAGWSGSDTSEERAKREVADGSLTMRLRHVLAVVERAGTHGVTWSEVGRILDLHHGSASSALTNLHRQGQITRTTRVRGRSKVYVTPHNAMADDHLEPYIPRTYKVEREVIALQDQIARARMALLTGERSEALRILEES